MARSSKATLALLIYGIMMHYSAFCTPIGMTFPKMRYVYAFMLDVLRFYFLLKRTIFCDELYFSLNTPEINDTASRRKNG